MSDPDVESATKLVRMANQIADFFAAQPGGTAATSVCDHLRSFWTKTMRDEIIEHLERGGEGLRPLAIEAVKLLRQSQSGIR